MRMKKVLELEEHCKVWYCNGWICVDCTYKAEALPREELLGMQ